MKLLNVTIKNVRSISEVAIVLNYHMLQLKAENMTGKTSILYAIQFALFGMSGIKLRQSDLFRDGTKQSEVVLEFEKLGKIYTVKRTKSHAEIRQGDTLLAAGKAQTSKMVLDVLGLIDPFNMITTASSVVDMINPALLEHNVAGFNGFQKIVDAVGQLKQDQKNYQDVLENLTALPVFNGKELAQFKKEQEAYAEELETFNRLKERYTNQIEDHEKYQALTYELSQLEETEGVTPELLESMEKTYEAFLAYERGNEKLKDFYPVDIPHKYVEQRDKFLADQKLWESYQEAVKKLEGIKSLKVLKARKKSLKLAIGEKQGQYAVWQDWHRNKPDVSDIPVTLSEVEKILKSEFMAGKYQSQIETARCPECGSVLDEEVLREAEDWLSKYVPVNWARKAEDFKRELEAAKAYPDKPVEVSRDELYDLDEDLDKVNRGLWLWEKYGGEVKQAVTRPEAFKFNDDVDELLPANPHPDWVSSYRETREKLLAIPEPSGKCPSKEDLATYRRKLQVADKRLYLTQEQAKLGDLSKVNTDKLEAALQQLVSPTPPDISYEKALSMNEDAKEREQERTKIKDDRDACKLAITETNKALKKVRDEVWVALMREASNFVSKVTGGVVSSIGRDSVGFTYKEGLQVRSVRAGSGLQRTLIGLALQITRKKLQGDTLPLLLDEVAGRVSGAYLMPFMESLQSLPYQIIVVSHNEVEGALMETVDVAGLLA